MTVNKAKIYIIADQIITVLSSVEEAQSHVILNSIPEDPTLVRFVLGFLLKFRFIDYDGHRDMIKLNKSMHLGRPQRRGLCV